MCKKRQTGKKPIDETMELRRRIAELEKSDAEVTRLKEENRALFSELQQERNRLAALVNSIGEEVWFADGSKHITLINPSALKEFAIDAAESLDIEKLAQSLEIYRTDGTPRPIEEAPPLRALKGEVVRNQEEIVRTAVKGELRYREVSSAPVKDGAGNIVGVVSVVRDITNRKHAEESLRQAHEELESRVRERTVELQSAYDSLAEKEKLYRNLFENASIGMFQTTFEGRFIRINNAFATMLGYESPEEVLSTVTDAATQIHTDPRNRHHLLEALNRKDWCYVEQPYFRKDGSVMLGRLAARKVLNPDGTPAYIEGIVEDITEAKKALDNLRESEAKYRALFDHANDAIFLLKGDMFVDCNPRTLKTFRCTRAELLSQKIHGFSPRRQPDGSTSTQKILKRIEDALSGEPQYFDWVHRRCDNTSFDAEVGLNRIEIGGETLLLSIVRDVTERRHAETELRASEEKLRTVFDQTFQLMGLLTPDGILLSANRAALAYKGLKDFEVMGKPIWETPWWSHDEKERHKLKDAINRAKEGDTVRYEATQLHLDGTLRYIDFSLRPSKNEKGVIIYLIAEGHDITVMKEKEEALRQAEAKYRAIFENADMGIYQTTSRGRIVNANPALARILGYDSPQDLIESISDVVTQVYVNPEDRTRVVELCRDPGFVERLEVIFYKKDKSKVWVSINCRPIKDPAGNIMYFEGTIEDITERKMTEKNLQESEEKYRSVVESSFVGFYIIQDRVFRFVNKGFCEITGYGYDEVVDGDALDIVHPDDRKMVESYIEKRITGQTSHVEYLLRVVKKDGHITHVKIFGSSLIFNGRRAAAGTMIDVTREKDLEQQLLRTQKLEAIGTLAGGIAHDFNNILSGIIGFTEMVQDDLSPDSPGHRRLGLVLKGARRGRDLVKQILTFSRQTEHEQEPVNLSEIVNEGLKLLRPILPATIEIRSKRESHDATVLADPIQIHQVLMNLCTNSSHAMGKKGGVLEINVRTEHLKKGDPLPSPDMKPGDYITLSVHDTGRGMGPEVLERIFDPFFTTKTKGEGTGLGLSMVHGIVKSHRGFIKVDSEPGKGSTFYIYLPKIEKQVNFAGIGPLSVSGGKEHILFVDDEDIIVELNDERLTRLGYEVKATTSNVEALEIFRREPEKFDLVITDYTMPNMTGMDLAKEMLKIRKDIPIILCTGYNDRISADKARKAGIKEFVMKPLSAQDMSAAIYRALGKKPGALHL